jgi:hypothetical protein
MPAVGALNIKLTAIRRPAAANGINCLKVPRKSGMAILAHKCVTIVTDNKGQVHDYTLLKSTWRVFTSAFMVVRLSFSAISERWA